MSISKLLSESIGERTGSHDVRQLERLVATASTNEERVRRVTEAYDGGRVSIDTYVAAIGMKKANVSPATSKEFAEEIIGAMKFVPSKTVAGFEAYWRNKHKDGFDLDASFAEACKCQDEEDPEEDDTPEEDDAEED